MALRHALFVVGAATVASFAAGWWTGLSAKSNPATADASQVGCTLLLDPETRTTVGSTEAAVPPEDATFKDKILPFVQKYCVSCHNMEKAAGGLTLEGYVSEAHARKDRKTWAEVQHRLAAGDMPPPKSTKPKPTKDETAFVITWIENTLTKIDCGGTRDPGRVTLRRLNRAEYNNTIRDLCGVDFKPAEGFPSDDVGYGFDNIGDVLSFQPVLLEKYMAAADKVLDTALALPAYTPSSKQTFRPQNLTTVPRAAKTGDPGRPKIVFTSEGSAVPANRFNFPEEAEYVFRVRGWGTKLGDEYPKVALRVDGKDLKEFTVEAPQEKPQTFEVREKLTAGEKRVAVAFTNPFEDKAQKKFREFGLELLEIEGPINPARKPDPGSVKLLLVARPADKADNRAAAEKVLTNFARRAYRRPVRPDEVQRLMRLYDVAEKQGEPFERAVRLPMKAVLCSPHFLYRIEEDPNEPNGVRTLNDFEFATRLSYFLWSSMPDEELFRLAEKGELRKGGNLEAQVRRMLKDPKAKALSENFAGQWLQLRNLRTLAPDKGYYPGFDEALRAGMIREAEAFFEYIVQNDRGILEFLDADYTFVNDRLAKHYGVANVTGPEFRKVQLPDDRRGGIITMASTLTVTSNPTRTSPVKRGKWILENILGTPPPPPAPDVPELPPTAQLKGTLRQQMEQHRANPSCATCHAKLDPLGFGLENFDGIGGWRTTDNKQPIDSSGVLPDGAKFSGPAELRKVLLAKSELLRRCLAEKLLTFGLGRGLEYYDKCAVDDIVAATRSGQDRFSALVLAVVRSDPFQKRKGKRSE